MLQKVVLFLFCLVAFVSTADRGSYIVNGLGARKQAILNNGVVSGILLSLCLRLRT